MEAAFALMTEASRRAGNSGEYNDYIRGIPVIPNIDEKFDFDAHPEMVIPMVKFMFYQFQSKPGNYK